MSHDRTVSIHLGMSVAQALLVARGWTLDHGGNAYVKPGRMPYSEGGQCGPDFLWDLSEALTVAPRDEVRAATL